MQRVLPQADAEFTEYDSKGTTRKYFTVTIADRDLRVTIRVYQTMLKKTLRVGRRYMFTNASLFSVIMLKG